MLKRNPALRLAFMFCLLLPAACSYSQVFVLKNGATTTQVMSLAENALPKIIQWIEPEYLTMYGFHPQDDFSKIRLGEPVWLTTLDDLKPALQEPGKVTEISSIMYPIILNQTARCFLYVSVEEGQWKAVGIGSKEYAGKIPNLLAQERKTPFILAAHLPTQEEYVQIQIEGKMLYQPIWNRSGQGKIQQFSLEELLALTGL